MTRLEDLLRDSLADRAADVESTPALWHRVEQATVARTRRTWALAAAGTAMAVAAGAVVLPGVLDRTPERPTILIDPTPSPAPTTSAGDDATPDGEGASTLVDPTATHAVAVVDGLLHWYDLDDPDAEGPALAVPVDGQVLDLAVRPRVAGDDWYVAVVVRNQGQLQLRLAFLGPDAVASGEPQGFLDLEVAAQPDDGDLQPGVAWAPDGSAFGWLRHDGDETRFEAFDGWDPAGVLPLTFCCAPGGLLADGEVAGRLTLQDWTWDVRYEDGVVGRLFLGGDGRSWQVPITQDADTSLDLDGMDPIDLAVDVDVAGPATGPVGLLLDGLRPGRAFAVDRLADGRRLLSWEEQIVTRIGDFGDVSAAGEQVVVSTSGTLHFHGPGVQYERQSSATIGAVDLAHTPWDPPFVGADDQGDVDGEDPTAAAVPAPEFVVVATGSTLEVVRNWVGEGEPEVVLGLGDVPAFEGPAPIHGVAVRPGSTLEDLEAVALVLNEGLYEFWWVRSVDATTTWEQFPRQHQPVAPAGDDLRPIPVFSPDHASGDRYLTWIDHHEGGDQTIRFVGWRDGAGPGTGDPADDNTSFALPDRQLLQVDGWRWAQDSGDGWTTIEITATSWDEQGQTSALVNEFDRGPDGAISLGADCWCGEPGHGSHTHESVRHARSGWAWTLTAGPEGLGIFGWHPDAGPEGVRLTMPPALRDSPGGASMELRAWGDTVVVLEVSEGIAWVLRPDGTLDTIGATAFDFLG